MSSTLKLTRPGANLPAGADFRSRHNTGEVGTPVAMQERSVVPDGEARFASPRDSVSRNVIRPHLGDQEYAVALTGNHLADQFLGAAVAVYFSRVDQCHPKRKTSTQRFFLNSLRASPLRETSSALAERRGDDAVAELYRASCAVRSHARCGGKSRST